MENSLPLDVYWIFKDAYHHIRKDLHNRLTDSGVTWPQFHALYHIEEKGTPPNELARELNCNASNMTGLIDRMIENNWVYREHSEEDRRVWMVKLTDEGKDLKAKLIPKHHQNIRERMGVLNEQELAALKSILEKLIDVELKEIKS
jgi:MarR family 2-MHQ and catechol resistance regulon transcriptional repressor